MGAGILPVALYRGTLFLLLGKERNLEWSDFGGGRNPNENIKKTHIREGMEELNGILGCNEELEERVNNNLLYTITYQDKIKQKRNAYTTYVFRTDYDKNLPIYFSNFNKFAEIHLKDKISKNGLFEKSEIQWISIQDLKNKNTFKLRPWYEPVIDTIIKKEALIIKQIQSFKH